jgi:hypothetical protein
MPYSRRFILSAALVVLGTSARAQSPADARVKARLALTLARFTQWPAAAFAAPSDPVVMCLMHRDGTLADAFAELANQTVAGRPVRVVGNSEKGMAGCHVVFVHGSVERAAAGAIAAAAALPLLTIGDGEGFAARGGMVELVNDNDSMRLDVNLKALRASQLGLSSQVLKLARQVRE